MFVLTLTNTIILTRTILFLRWRDPVRFPLQEEGVADSAYLRKKNRRVFCHEKRALFFEGPQKKLPLRS